jgi:predicted acyltransferase
MEKATVTDGQVADKRVQAFDGVSRFLSLDVFRGITICVMIIVNTPGKGATIYSYLIHAPWLGFTLADLVDSAIP